MQDRNNETGNPITYSALKFEGGKQSNPSRNFILSMRGGVGGGIIGGNTEKAFNRNTMANSDHLQ